MWFKLWVTNNYYASNNFIFLTYSMWDTSSQSNDSSVEDVLVRHDKSWPIIWSKWMERYVVPVTDEARTALYSIMQDKDTWLDNFDLPAKLKEEFRKIWFHGRVREIFFNSEKELGAPLEYYFDYTNLCNLSCDLCYNKNHLWNRTMPQDMVTKLISEMYKRWVMRLHLAWWEPTINPKGLNNYLSTATKYGIVTSMVTNWLLLNDEICEIITNNNVFSVSVSIDWATEEINNRRRGSWNLAKAIKWIQKLAEYRKKKWVKMEIDIKPTYLPDANLEELEALVLLAIDLGADKIKLANPERSLNNVQWYFGDHREDYYNTGDFINTLKEKYSDKISITNITNPLLWCLPIGVNGMKGCIWAQELITINPDWRITPCLMDDYDLGSIYEWSTMENFWNNSPLLKEYLQKINNTACWDCISYAHCRWWCQVRKIVQYGEIRWKDPLCPTEYKLDMKAGDIQELEQHSTMENFKTINVFHSL